MADKPGWKVYVATERERLVGQLIVILVSDHGENMWAEDLPYRYKGPNHGFHPYGEGQHHVALAIHFPKGSMQGNLSRIRSV